MPLLFSPLLKIERLAGCLIACGIVFAGCMTAARAQTAAPPLVPPSTTVATNGPLPEPIYWKQDLFLIPYQWGSAADPAAAQAVWLFVSKDRGASWQKISEANPQVRAFNYRADGEGEYWFAIRTLDRQGREWPAGPYRPELRVIVDTTIPRIEELRGQILPGGQTQITWRCSDTNLDADSLLIEAQTDGAGTWQAVPLTNHPAISPSAVASSALGLTTSGQVQWQSPANVRPLAIRATVLDRAKNAATYCAQLTLIADAGAGTAPFTAPTPLQAPKSSGWTSATSAPPQSAASINQPWPSTPGRTPFRLSSVANTEPSDGITAYGNPQVVTTPPVTPTPTPPVDNDAKPSIDSPRSEMDWSSAQKTISGGIEQAPPNGPRFAALDPFRQTSTVKRLPAPPPVLPRTVVEDNSQRQMPVGPIDAHLPASPAMTKRVGSRTFALEYDLDDTGRWGVSKIELWGTRDGGKSWHSFAVDDDHRSPLIVTVDEQGLYGFRIAVDVAGSAPAMPPSPGDEPELWISVDLQRPAVELTAIERGDGNLADHLTFRWKVVDDNLEARPIALFYSSRPTGPWSAIATSLEDTGEYTWRVERFVPARFYVRVEARDTAGNLAAFQTREPIDFVPLASPGHLRSAEAVGPVP